MVEIWRNLIMSKRSKTKYKLMYYHRFCKTCLRLSNVNKNIDLTGRCKTICNTWLDQRHIKVEPYILKPGAEFKI